MSLKHAVLSSNFHILYPFWLLFGRGGVKMDGTERSKV